MEKLVEKDVKHDSSKEIVRVFGDPKKWTGYVEVGAVVINAALAVGRYFLIKRLKND